MEAKIAHLQMIQLIITRMNANSFLLRGWTVTIVAALFALAAKDAKQIYVLVAYLPTIIFWALDGYYLRQERLFRRLYNSVADTAPDNIDFGMDTSGYSEGWFGATLWGTNLMFYGAVIGVILLVMFVFPR